MRPGELPEPGTFTTNLQPDVRKFAALTKLQHDRFRIWTNDDNFHLPDDGVLPIPRERLEDVDLNDQPGELTRAILETAIGDPLYPGIEMYWIAKLNTTVGVPVIHTLLRLTLTMIVFAVRHKPCRKG